MAYLNINEVTGSIYYPFAPHSLWWDEKKASLRGALADSWTFWSAFFLFFFFFFFFFKRQYNLCMLVQKATWMTMRTADFVFLTIWEWRLMETMQKRSTHWNLEIWKGRARERDTARWTDLVVNNHCIHSTTQVSYRCSSICFAIVGSRRLLAFPRKNCIRAGISWEVFLGRMLASVLLSWRISLGSPTVTALPALRGERACKILSFFYPSVSLPVSVPCMAGSRLHPWPAARLVHFLWSLEGAESACSLHPGNLNGLFNVDLDTDRQKAPPLLI